MSYQEIIDKIKPDFQSAVDEFKTELLKIRSSRLSPAMVEDIKADCFGQLLPLKHLGAISNASPRELLIQLWDKSYVEGAVAAIERESLGLSVRIDGHNVFLTAPALTEESRQHLIQLLNKKKENVFQEIRHLRDKAWRSIQDGFQLGEITEDDKYKGKDKLDEATREYREKVEETAKSKEQEIKG